MITIKEFMDVVDYRISGTDPYYWAPYGHDLLAMDSWSGTHENGWSINIVFDTKNQTVYEMTACDYLHNRAYRMIHPDYVKATAEAENASPYLKQAWDEVDWTDLEVKEDMLEKAAAIVAGEEYDTRIMVPIEFSDQDLLKFMKIAHERDITFNRLVEIALEEAIARELS